MYISGGNLKQSKKTVGGKKNNFGKTVAKHTDIRRSSKKYENRPPLKGLFTDTTDAHSSFIHLNPNQKQLVNKRCMDIQTYPDTKIRLKNRKELIRRMGEGEGGKREEERGRKK